MTNEGRLNHNHTFYTYRKYVVAESALAHMAHSWVTQDVFCCYFLHSFLQSNEQHVEVRGVP